MFDVDLLNSSDLISKRPNRFIEKMHDFVENDNVHCIHVRSTVSMVV